MRLAIPLRPLLWFDAATCAAMGMLLFTAASSLAPMLALPQALLAGAGLLLLPFAAFVAWAASRPLPGRAAQLIIAANAAWAFASLALLAGPWVRPTMLGAAFVMAQAAAVAVIALLQHMASRRTSATA